MWNIEYHWVLWGFTLRGVTVTCYTDDTFVMTYGSNHSEAKILATGGAVAVSDTGFGAS